MLRRFVAVIAYLFFPQNIFGLPSVPQTPGNGGNATGVFDMEVFVYPNEDNFPAEPCSPTNSNSEDGVCLCQEICSVSGGVGDSIGSCQQGICCTFRKQCSENQRSVEIKGTVENLMSAGLTGACKFVFPRQQGICQVRLDFVNVVLAEATSTGPTAGNCESESLTVTGSANLDGPLRVCGVLTGQHKILSYGATSNKISLTMDSEISAPNYAIRATQIPCDSPNKTPDDCLQYFSSSTSPVKSFGFPRQLNNQKYTICVNPSSGGSALSWTTCTDTDTFYPVADRFKVSQVSAICTTDWIVINDKKVYGQQFQPIQTSIGIHSRIHVHFDENETGNDIFYPVLPLMPGGGDTPESACSQINIPSGYQGFPTPTPALCTYINSVCECSFSNKADALAQSLVIMVGNNPPQNYMCPEIPGYTPYPERLANDGDQCRYFSNLRLADKANTGFCLRYHAM